MKLTITAIALFLSFNVGAKNFETESIQLCEKVRQCMLDKMSGQDVPPGMEKMIKPMVEGMCAQMTAQFNKANTSTLQESAVKCISSMAALSCAELMDGGAETKECTALEQKYSK